MDPADLLKEVQTEFFNRLQEKTNWGRNDIKILYNESEISVLRNAITTLKDTDGKG
jgi:hypothetical protein